MFWSLPFLVVITVIQCAVNNELGPIEHTTNHDENKSKKGDSQTVDVIPTEGFIFSEGENYQLGVPFDSSFFSISTIFLFEETQDGSRRVILDNHDTKQMKGFRISLFEISQNATCIEFSYHDTNGTLRHLHSSPSPLTMQWNYLLCTTDYDSKQDASSVRVFLNGNLIINEIIHRSERSLLPIHIGNGVDGRNSFNGNLNTILIYATAIAVQSDLLYRKIIQSYQNSNSNMIQSLMENEERLVMVVVSSPSSLHLITPYSSKTLYMKVDAPQETVGVKKRVSLKPLINSTSRIISHNKSILLENQCTISNETPSLDEVHSVEEYEVYLQNYSTSKLREGDYHNSVPKELQDDWTRLFDSRAEQVRESTKHFWKNYQRYAYGCDELAPVSKGCKNNWGGVGMTLIDSLDTLWIMDLKEEFEEAVAYIHSHIHFTADYEMSTFEFTIRVLGGLLSGYHLSHDQRLLDKAIEAGDLLYSAFSNDMDLPYAKINMKTRQGVSLHNRVSLAEFGTLTLEFRYLSALTHNNRYSRVIDRIYPAILKEQTSDGLFAQLISFMYLCIGSLTIYYSQTTNQATNHLYSVGGCSDTFYEYLLKGYIQSNYTDQSLMDQFEISIEGILTKLVRKNKLNGMAVVGLLANKRFIPSFELLSCFLPGMIFLYNNNIYHNTNSTLDKQGRALLHSCFMMMNCTVTGLPAEVTKVTDIQGMSLSEKQRMYLLRPEFIESFFYLKETQKDPIAQEWGWLFYQALERYCRIESGYAAYPDVQNKEAIVSDSAESFFVAETLKYLYLLFSSKQIVNFNTTVLTTEAHIFPIL